jgi:hypothetical protein
MSIRKAVLLTAAVAAVVVTILVLSWYLPGCAKAPTAGPTFTIALDPYQTTGAAYNIRFVPVNLLIDDEGFIRGIWPGAFGSTEHVAAWLDDLVSSEVPPRLAGVAPEIGHTAPDFTLATLDGATVTLSQLRGQWVLLNFWTTRCRYCVMQMPYLQAAFEENAGQIEFIGINLGESEQRVRTFFGG